MALNPQLVAGAQAAGERIGDRLRDVEDARSEFQRAVRALYLAGGSLREIAEALGLSHQRVHQVLGLPAAPGRSGRGLVCSFCARHQSKVRKLIAGPGGVAICDACVPLAAVVAESGVAAGDTHASLRPDHTGRGCSFCGKRGEEAAGYAASEIEEKLVCAECLVLASEILAEELGPLGEG